MKRKDLAIVAADIIMAVVTDFAFPNHSHKPSSTYCLTKMFVVDIISIFWGTVTNIMSFPFINILKFVSCLLFLEFQSPCIARKLPSIFSVRFLFVSLDFESLSFFLHFCQL